MLLSKERLIRRVRVEQYAADSPYDSDRNFIMTWSLVRGHRHNHLSDFFGGGPVKKEKVLIPCFACLCAGWRITVKTMGLSKL